MTNERILKWIFIVSAVVMVITYFYKDRFPDPSAYDLHLLQPPLQEITSRKPFSIEVNDYQYTIKPKFDYELTGVVVTYNDANSFGNIWHHKRWKDFINVRDLCVIWEPNIRSGVYKKLHFSSDSWTCWVSWTDMDVGKQFYSNALSNNHLLTNSDVIKKALLNAEKGDVVRIKGVLAEYVNQHTGGSRGTSIRRDDHGNGACETIFIDDFEIIKKANAYVRLLYSVSKAVTFLSLIAYLILIGFTPYRTRNR